MPSIAKVAAFLVLAMCGMAHAAPETDSQLTCRTKVFRPKLDFEFRFHTNFEFIFPLRQFCDVPLRRPTAS